MSADGKDRGSPPLTETPGAGVNDRSTAGDFSRQGTPGGELSSWGELQLLELIGSGGFGRVFRARDPALAREIALKIIRVPEAEAASTILREGQLLARLRHRNIVTVYGAQQRSDEIGLLMELVRGRSLADIVERDGPLGSDEAAVVGSNLCQALAAVHGAGLVHRDVKARNVVRESGGRIVLMDFGAGLDRHEAREAAAEHMLTGTPLCMAPEVLLGHSATPSSDLYSLGVLLFFLVTGKHPVEAATVRDLVIAHSLGQRTQLVDLRPDVPERFVRVVDRALAANPGERYTSAGRMMHDLLEILPAGATSVSVPAPVAVPRGDVSVPVGGGEPRIWTGSDRVVSRAPDSSATMLASRVLVWVGAACGVVIVVLALGFLSSMALNNTLGRSSEFANESPLAWLIWGIRSLVAPAVYMAIAAIPVVLLASAWRLLNRVSSPIRRSSDAIRMRAAGISTTLRLTDPVVLGQVLFAFEVLAFYLVWWRFEPLLLASSTFIADADVAELAKLRPDNIDEHILYGRVLAMLILFFGLAWYWIVARRRMTHSTGGTGTMVTGFAILALFVLGLAVPYRILWHTQFERVRLGSERCYLIGERRDELLLYCPDITGPKNRVVASADPNLHRENLVESLFTPAPVR